MWKKTILSLILVLILATPHLSNASLSGFENSLKGADNCYSLGSYIEESTSYINHHYWGGFYVNSTEAQAGAQAHGGSSSSVNRLSYIVNVRDDGGGNPGYWQRYTSAAAPGGGKGHRFYIYFGWPNSQASGCTQDFAPAHLPFGSASFIFRRVSSCNDSQGNLAAESYEYRNLDTGEQAYATSGNIANCDEITIYQNEPWYADTLYDGDPLDDFVGGSGSDILNEIVLDMEKSGSSTAEGSDSGSDDSALLQNIATNTRLNTANQQILSNQITDQTNVAIKIGNDQKMLLASIASGVGYSGQRLDSANSLLQQIRDGLGEGGGGGGGDGPGAGEIGEAVGDELIESTEFTGQTGNEFVGILAEINAFRTELGIPENDDEYYPEGGINDEEDFKQAVQDMLIDKTDTTWFQALRNLMMMDRITAAGSCSASVALWGGSIELSVCGLQGALNVFGTVLLGFATITAFMVALRG